MLRIARSRTARDAEKKRAVRGRNNTEERIGKKDRRNRTGGEMTVTVGARKANGAPRSHGPVLAASTRPCRAWHQLLASDSAARGDSGIPGRLLELTDHGGGELRERQDSAELFAVLEPIERIRAAPYRTLVELAGTRRDRHPLVRLVQARNLVDDSSLSSHIRTIPHAGTAISSLICVNFCRTSLYSARLKPLHVVGPNDGGLDR